MAAYRLIILILIGGFATTLLEVRALHKGVVSEEPIAWVPTIAAAVGILASVAALFMLSKAALAGYFAVAIAGLVGLYQHTGFEPSKFATLLSWEATPPVVLALDKDEESREVGKSEEEHEPPPLAPLSLTGLAFIGAVLVWQTPGKSQTG